MFEPVEGLPPVLVGYYLALNERDLPRALSYIHPDATMTLESEPGRVWRQADGEVEQWLRESLGDEPIAIAPVSVEARGELTTVHVAIAILHSSGDTARLLQQVDYRVENDLIVAAHGRLARKRRNTARRLEP